MSDGLIPNSFTLHSGTEEQRTEEQEEAGKREEIQESQTATESRKSITQVSLHTSGIRSYGHKIN